MAAPRWATPRCGRGHRRTVHRFIYCGHPLRRSCPLAARPDERCAPAASHFWLRPNVLLSQNISLHRTSLSCFAKKSNPKKASPPRRFLFFCRRRESFFVLRISCRWYAKRYVLATFCNDGGNSLKDKRVSSFLKDYRFVFPNAQHHLAAYRLV